MRRIVSVLALAVLSLAPTVRSAEATGDTPDSLKQLYSDGKYTELLPKVKKALALHGTAGEEFDKYDLYHWEGESLLRVKSGGPAGVAFTEAAKATDKPDQSAIATATAALIKQSPGLKYTPKIKEDKATTKPVSIDIVEADSRKDAFAAFLKDLLAKDKPIVDRAKAATSMDQIVKAAEGLSDLRPVEIAATGSDSQSKQMVTDLGTKASTMIGDALDKMGVRVSDIGDIAKNKPGEATSGLDNLAAAAGEKPKNQSQATGKAAPGLSSAAVNELRQIISNAFQLGSMAKSMETTFGTPEDFKTLETKAETVIEAAHKVLQEYGKEPKPKAG